MFDIGMSELLVVGTVALIVIGPKDLPELFRSLGRMTAKLRAMSREFSRAMEAAANESGVKDVAADLRNATSAKSMGLDAVKDAAAKFEKWDPLKNVAKPAAAPVRSAAPAATAPAPPATPVSPAPEAAPAPAPKPRGPATQALADAQAARKAVAQETAAKLRKPVVAISDPVSVSTADAETVAPAPAKRPRAPRKPKKQADA